MPPTSLPGHPRASIAGDWGLRGTHVLVTGAAGGIGSAICKTMQEAGAFPIGVDRVADPSRDILSCDIGNDEAVWGCARYLEERGIMPVTVVHTAAISENLTTLESEPDSFARIFNVNTIGAVRLVQAFAPAMRKAGCGSFIFLSSINGQMGCPGLAAYATSKGALDALTKTVALELASDGIRVNAIAPASIDTPMLNDKFAASADPVAAKAVNVRRHPLGRLGTPQDIANMVSFLASDAAGWITGGIHLIDGGAHLARR